MPSAEEVLDRISDGFIAFDQVFRYVFVNRVTERFVGMPRKKLLGRVVWEVFPKVRGSRVEKEYRRALATGKAVEFEVPSPTIKGRWVEHCVYPTGSGLAVYFRDVTDRHRGDEELRAAHARFRAIFDNSLDGQALTAPDGRIFAVNEAAARMLGRTPDEVVRAGREAVVDATDPRAHEFLEARARDGHARAEMRMKRKNGSTFVAEVASSIFADEGGELRTSLSFRDVTARERTENALKLLADAGDVLSASLQMETAMGHLAQRVVPAFADLCIVDVVMEGVLRRVATWARAPEAAERLTHFGGNGQRPKVEPALQRVLDTQKPELVNDVTDEWLQGATLAPEQARLAREFGLDSVMLLPLIVNRENVGVLTLATTQGRPRYDAADFALARTLADRAAVAVENARLYQDALRANALRQEMLGLVSHDLRNPLNAISIAADLMASKPNPPDELRLLRGALGRANRLIHDLLLTTKIEAGTVYLEREPCDLASLLGEMERLNAPLARKANLTLEVHAAPNLPQVMVDRHRFHQALENLISNAIKFTKAGGKVTVTAEPNDDGVTVTVADTGVGITERDLPHLFDRFWQGARARKAGAGLGLSIAKGVVEAHGGRMWVESQPGVGTQFHFTLPRA